MRIISTLIVTLALALTACADKDKDKDNDTAEGHATAAKGSDTTASKPKAAAGPAELTAPAFFADYSSLEGMEVMDKYGDGVVVSGKVLRTIEEMDGSLGVWLDAGGGHWVSLKFADQGEAAKAKGVAADAEVTAKCQVGGATDKYVMNIDCELQ